MWLEVALIVKDAGMLLVLSAAILNARQGQRKYRIFYLVFGVLILLF